MHTSLQFCLSEKKSAEETWQKAGRIKVDTTTIITEADEEYENNMIEMKAIVQNDRGIHCRPSGIIYKAIEGYKGEITLISREMEVVLTSIMDIIVLGLFKNDKVIVRVSGENEEGMCKKLIELFETHYDFPPQNGSSPG
ncbi:MAG: HPr family phosphocarrier protein [Spirochaetales bacterium]|nr:HPr family phosphocarrier protein [Spirochaetales bacterium]